MSKMSQLHAELTEQASELGFESLDQAIESGEYEVISTDNWAELVPTKDEQDKAHEAWLKRKERTLKELRDLQETLETLADGEPHEVSSYWADTIWGAINFIEEGEM